MEKLKKFSLVIFATIIVIIFAELILRLFPFFKHKYALENFVYHSCMEEFFNDEFYLYRPSSILSYERIPNAEPYINSYGLIGDEFEINKKENEFRILVLGDSLAADNYFIEYLRPLLNNLNTSFNYEIINAGVPGYNVWHYFRFLKYKGIKLSPDMVIISFCLNDFDHFSNIYYKTKNKFMEFQIPNERIQRNIIINYFLFRNFYLYRCLIITMNKFQQANNAEFLYMEDGIFYMKRIKQICQNNKIPFFCFIWPYFILDKEYKRYQREQYLSMTKVLKKLEIDYIDLHDYFPNKKRGALKIDSQDYIHPTKDGHKIAAEVIFEYLKKNKYTM